MKAEITVQVTYSFDGDDLESLKEAQAKLKQELPLSTISSAGYQMKQGYKKLVKTEIIKTPAPGGVEDE